jgi:hypothetical protein
MFVLYAATTVFVGVAPAMTQQATAIQKNYTIALEDEFVVRRLHPPLLFDDKGKPRKPTAEDLRQMKGIDPKLKGYKAELSDLKPGHGVVVTLARAKASASKAKGDRGGKSDSNDGSRSRKPTYTILGEYTGRLVRPPGKPKTKDGKEDPNAKATMVVGFASLLLPGQQAPAPRDKVRVPPTVFAVRIMIVAEPPEP